MSTRKNYFLAILCGAAIGLNACGKLDGPGGTDQTATAIPALNPAPGVFTTTTSVTILSGQANSVIHYTMDGTDPTSDSPTYSGIPIQVSSSMIIKALAVAENRSPSPVVGGQYTIDPNAPTPTPPPTASTPVIARISPAALQLPSSEEIKIFGVNLSGVDKVVLIDDGEALEFTPSFVSESEVRFADSYENPLPVGPLVVKVRKGSVESLPTSGLTILGQNLNPIQVLAKDHCRPGIRACTDPVFAGGTYEIQINTAYTCYRNSGESSDGKNHFQVKVDFDGGMGGETGRFESIQFHFDIGDSGFSHVNPRMLPTVNPQIMQIFVPQGQRICGRYDDGGNSCEDNFGYADFSIRRVD